MVNLAILSYLLYHFSYGIDFFLIIYIIFFTLFVISKPTIVFPNIISVLAFSYVMFVLALGIIGARFDYIEIDLLLSSGIILLLISKNKNLVNWNILHGFIICINIIFFVYWTLVWLTPYNGTNYNWLRSYDSLSIFFGIPRLNNLCLYYFVFLVCSMRLRLTSLILVAPALSVVPYSLIFLRMLSDNIGKSIVFIVVIMLFISRIDLSYLSDFYAAFVEQKSISINNRMLLEFPGFFGSTDNIRISESMILYIAQKYGYTVCFLLLFSILNILHSLNISLFNSIIIILLTNINPISIGALVLFAKIAQERNFRADSSHNL